MPPSRPAAATQPLSGVTVLDCSRVLAGPFATMLLADLGARVWKLEPPAGDETRGWGPPFWGDRADGLSAYFASVNRGKQSLVVDLSTEAGRAVLDRLASRADALVHNYRPATARRLGLDRARLRATHPDLVVAAVVGFGGTGARSEEPAYDLLAQALTGHMAVTGEPDGPPLKAGVALLDLIAGLEAAIGLLAGLVGRRGLTVEVSLADAGLTSLANVLANQLATGVEPRRWGNAHPNIVPYQAFATADGRHVVVAVGNDRQFARLLEVLGLPPDPRFATNAGRVERRDELVPLLAGAIARRDSHELLAALVAVDVPAGPVHSVGEAVAWAEAGEPGGWVLRRDGVATAPSPWHVDGARPPAGLRPPRLGEHTGAVLTDAGFERAEVNELLGLRVVS